MLLVPGGGGPCPSTVARGCAVPPCLAGAGRDGEAQEQSHGRGASELGVQGVLHLRRQLGVEGGDAHPEIWSEMEESRQHYGRAPCTPAPAGGCLGTGARQGGVGRTHGPPPPRGITAGWGARSWSPVPTPATGPASRTEGAGYMLPTGGRLSPLPLSIPAVRIPPAIRPPRPGPYPSLRPGARVAAGSCGGPRCAGSSPPARRWSRGTACRCSGPACAPTQCGCWRSALQGRARREAQRSPTSPLPWLGRGMLCPGPAPPAPGQWEPCEVAAQGAGQAAPGSSCIVLGAMGLGSAGATGAGASLLQAPHAQRSPPHRGNPKSGSRARGCTLQP